MTPYGQMMATSTSDPYLYAGLYQDTEYGGHDAWYRNYSAEQSRWLRPDPYNGSYDLMNPQSFNRYMYVNGNPLTYVDPSGLANGWLTGVGGSVCSNTNGTLGDSSFSGINISTPIGNINPCDPAASLIAVGIQGTINGIWGTAIQAGEISPFVAAAITVACSIDNFNSAACGGSSGWASVAFGNGSVASKVVGDTTAVIGATLCALGGPTSPGCIGYAIYTVANDLFTVFWDLFGPPQFTGSLLPRPSDLGGLGTSPIGIPNQNLSIQGMLGQSSHGTVTSPGMNIP
ncbi:MAG: RHS repeat-associated core domain-containing protein [Acidobacteriaceae bacterium]